MEKIHGLFFDFMKFFVDARLCVVFKYVRNSVYEAFIIGY